MEQSKVVFSADQAAAALWTYGEDDLVDDARAISPSDLERLWTWAGDHWKLDHGLPLGARLTLDKVIAFAAISHFEGKVRPLKRERRRPQASMPSDLQNAEPAPPGSGLF